MSTQVASLYATLGCDVSGLQSGLSRARNALTSTANHFSVGAMAIGTALGNLAAQGVASLARETIQLGREALTAFADYERLGLSLQSLSARELIAASGGALSMADALAQAGPMAKDLLNWIQQLAINSPFSQSDISEAFRMAQAYGFTAKEAQGLLSTLIDFAAATGGTGQAVQQVALALGQINAKGHLAGQEILQLVNAGVNVSSVLAGMGYTLDDVSKGIVSADDFIHALTDTMNNDFGGAAERQAGTFSGLLSSLKDIKEVGLREFFTGTFTAVQPYLEKFVGWITSKGGLNTLRQWGDVLGNELSGALAFAGGLFGFIAGRVQAFFNMLGNGVSPLDAVRRIISMLLPPELREKFDWLWGVMTNLGALALGAFNAVAGAVAGVIGTVVGAVQSVWPTILELFGRLLTWWNENGPGLIATVSGLFTRVGAAVSGLLQKVIPFFVEMFAKVTGWLEVNGPLIQAFAAKLAGWFGSFVEAATGAWAFISPILSGIVDLVLGIGKFIMQVVTGDWSGAWDSFVAILWGAVESFKTAWAAFADWVAGWFGTSWAGIKEQWSTNWETFKVIVTTVWANIQTAIQTKLTEMTAGLQTWLITTINNIKAKVAEFVAAGAALVNGLWEGLKAAWASMISAFNDLVALLPQAVKDILGISSPSRVFAVMGRQMMSGLASGINGGAGMALAALQGVSAELALTGARGTSTHTTTYQNADTYQMTVVASEGQNAQEIADVVMLELARRTRLGVRANMAYTGM